MLLTDSVLMDISISGILVVMNNVYELTVVFPDNNEALKKKVIKVVGDFVSKRKGEIMKQDSWGVKELAYKIKGQKMGLYEHFVISIDPLEQPKLDKKLRVEEEVLRYLFVRV